MEQMYEENGKKTIAKKRYYFKKGYTQVTLAQKEEVRQQLMSALGISRLNYFSSILNKGIVDISMSKYESINTVFQEYGINEVWEIEPNT